MDGNKWVQATWQSRYLYVGEWHLGTRDCGFVRSEGHGYCFPTVYRYTVSGLRCQNMQWDLSWLCTRTQTKVMDSFLALQVFSWSSQGAFSFVGDLGVWFHLGWVKWYLLLLFYSKSTRMVLVWRELWMGFPWATACSWRLGNPLEQYLRMSKRREHNFHCREENWLCLAV